MGEGMRLCCYNLVAGDKDPKGMYSPHKGRDGEIAFPMSIGGDGDEKNLPQQGPIPLAGNTSTYLGMKTDGI